MIWLRVTEQFQGFYLVCIHFLGADFCLEYGRLVEQDVDIIYSFVHLFIQHSFSSDRVDTRNTEVNRHTLPPLMELRQMGETNVKQTYTNIYIQIAINAVKEIDYKKEKQEEPSLYGEV